MKFIIVLTLLVIEVPSYYCNEQNAFQLSSENEPVLNLYPDNFGVKLKKIGDENDQNGLSSDVESADKNAVISSLEGRKCGRIISKCVRDTDCCTGYCQTLMGRCLFNPFHHASEPKCRDIHNQCLYNYQCCSGVCDPVTGLCQHHLVTLHPPVYEMTVLPCSPDKGPCQVNNHCCSKICDTIKGSCNPSKKSRTKKLDGEVVNYPILLKASIGSLPKQSGESNPEENETTESEQIVTKTIQKELTSRKVGSFIVKHEEVYETSETEEKNGEQLPTSFLSLAQNPLEEFSINEQRVLETFKEPEDEFGTSSLGQQKNVDGSSLVQRKYEPIPANSQGNIGGSTSSDQRIMVIPQKEDKDGSLLVKRILETNSSHKQNNNGGSSSSGPSLHQQKKIDGSSGQSLQQQDKIEGSSVQQRIKSTSLNKDKNNEESSSSWQRQMGTPIKLQTNISGSPSTQQRIVQTSSQQIGQRETQSSKEKTKSSRQPETNATSTKFLQPEQVKFERVKPNIEVESAPTNVTSTASSEIVKTTAKSPENPQETTTKKCLLNGLKCLHDDDCCSAICSNSSNSCTASSSQSSSQESFQQSSNESCLENMSTQ